MEHLQDLDRGGQRQIERARQDFERHRGLRDMYVDLDALVMREGHDIQMFVSATRRASPSHLQLVSVAQQEHLIVIKGQRFQHEDETRWRRYHRRGFEFFRGFYQRIDRYPPEQRFAELRVPRNREESPTVAEYPRHDPALANMPAHRLLRIFPVPSHREQMGEGLQRDRLNGWDVRASFQDVTQAGDGELDTLFIYHVEAANPRIVISFRRGDPLVFRKTGPDRFTGRAPEGTRLDWVMLIVHTLVVRQRHLEAVYARLRATRPLDTPTPSPPPAPLLPRARAAEHVDEPRGRGRR